MVRAQRPHLALQPTQPVRNLSCWSLCSPDKNQCGGTTNECTECKYDPSGAAGDYFCE